MYLCSVLTILTYGLNQITYVFIKYNTDKYLLLLIININNQFVLWYLDVSILFPYIISTYTYDIPTYITIKIDHTLGYTSICSVYIKEEHEEFVRVGDLPAVWYI